MQMLTVMSPCAYRVEAHTSITEAQEIMKSHGIRHLPVIDEDDVIGMLSERDIQRAKALGKDTYSTAGEVCSPDLHIALTTDSVADVVRDMSVKKSDCVLVSDEDETFVGIFTTTDCCRLLCLALEEIALRRANPVT